MRKLFRIALLAALCLALCMPALAEGEERSRTRIEVLSGDFDGRNALVEFRLTPVDPEGSVLFNPDYQEQDDALYVFEKRDLIPFPMLYRRDGKAILRYSPHITSSEDEVAFEKSFSLRGVDEEEDGSLVIRAYGRLEKSREELRLDVAAWVMIFDVLYQTDTIPLSLTADPDAAYRILDALLYGN